MSPLEYNESREQDVSNVKSANHIIGGLLFIQPALRIFVEIILFGFEVLCLDSFPGHLSRMWTGQAFPYFHRKH